VHNGAKAGPSVSKAVVADELLTVVQAAEVLRLSPKSVYKLIDEGRLPVVRMSARRLRLRRASLLAWLERQEDAPRKRGFR